MKSKKNTTDGLKNMINKNNQQVLPGDTLCSYEEYIPSNWTYIEDGYVKASICGKVIIDEDEKTISVTTLNPPEYLKEGDIVIGHITEVKANKALLTIKMIKGCEREIVTGYKGFVHISKASEDFVASMHDQFKIGDIVEARVDKIYGPEYIDLNTTSLETGVIKAMCTKCRKFMKFKENKLVCSCGKKDSRKISINYGGI